MKLRKYLEDRNIEKKEFARMIGVSETAIHNYLSGRRHPTLKAMYCIEIATKRKVTAEDFLDDADRVISESPNSVDCL